MTEEEEIVRAYSLGIGYRWKAIRLTNHQVSDYLLAPSAERAKAKVKHHWWAGHLNRGETLTAYIVSPDDQVMWRYVPTGSWRIRWEACGNNTPLTRRQ